METDLHPLTREGRWLAIERKSVMRNSRSATWLVLGALALTPLALGTFPGLGLAQSAPQSKLTQGKKVGVHLRSAVTCLKPGDIVSRIGGVVGAVDATGFMLTTENWRYGDNGIENGDSAKCTLYVPWTSVNYVEIDPK
jgi:hypothetical protein